MIWYRPRRLTVSSPRDEPNSEREPPAIFPSKVQQLAYKGSSFVATECNFWRTMQAEILHLATAPFMSSYLQGGPLPLHTHATTDLYLTSRKDLKVKAFGYLLVASVAVVGVGCGAAKDAKPPGAAGSSGSGGTRRR